MNCSEEHGIPATFPVPEGYVLGCPRCDYWKLRQELLGGRTLWRCSGPQSDADVLPGVEVGKGVGTLCGRLFIDEEIKSFVGLRMVKE